MHRGNPSMSKLAVWVDCLPKVYAFICGLYVKGLYLCVCVYTVYISLFVDVNKHFVLTQLNIFSLATIIRPLCSHRSRCRALLRARQRGESLCALLHSAGAQWDQQPSLHMGLQDKGKPQHWELLSDHFGTCSLVHTCKANNLFLTTFGLSLFDYRLTTGLASKWRTLQPWTSHRATYLVRGRCPVVLLVSRMPALSDSYIFKIGKSLNPHFCSVQTGEDEAAFEICW